MKQLIRHFKGEGIKAQLLRGAGGSAVVKALNMGLLLVSGVLLARMLGPEQYGIYAFVMSIITVIGLPTKAGLPTLLVRETARNHQEGNWGLMRGLLRLANTFVFSYSLVAALVSAIFVWWRWGGLESAQINSFLWAIWLLPIIAFENVRTGTLRGLRWVVSSQLPEKIIRPLVMVLLMGTAYLMSAELTSSDAVQFTILSSLMAFLFGLVVLHKALPNEVRQSPPLYTLKPWGLSLLPLSLFSGMKLMDAQITTLFLGLLTTVEEVGYFRVAVTGASLVAIGLMAVNMALAPQIARLYRAGEIDKLQRIITMSTRAVLVASVPVAIIFIFWGKELISWVFGEAYIEAAPALAILCIGQLVNTSVGSVALVLNMTGHEKQTIKGIVIALFLNIALSLILIPNYGLIGGAIASMTSLTVWNLILVWLTYKHTGLKTFAFVLK
ncbi:MAG: flippase [Saccharospirillum sp.]|nr:flippase [Saccharospirillum sp.]